MQLGVLSIRLAVKDIEASRVFYEKSGFSVFGGNAAQNWLIQKNGDHVIGLFQGMFEKNILTFNPGWDSNARKLESFNDVRELQRQLKTQGVKLQQEADESTTGRRASSQRTPTATRSSSISTSEGPARAYGYGAATAPVLAAAGGSTSPASRRKTGTSPTDSSQYGVRE